MTIEHTYKTSRNVVYSAACRVRIKELGSTLLPDTFEIDRGGAATARQLESFLALSQTGCRRVWVVLDEMQYTSGACWCLPHAATTRPTKLRLVALSRFVRVLSAAGT